MSWQFVKFKYPIKKVNIPDIQIKSLDQLSKKKRVSRAEIIRQAVSEYITSYIKNQKAYKSAFGIWKKNNIDSLSYERELRDEWNK